MTIAYALAWYVVFILSATVHEAAHAWAAKRGGDPTAYEGGQVSLNPWPHIKREPIGMVVIPIVTALWIHWPFGYAKTPYDPVWAHKHPRKAALMALAGPVANFILLFIAVAVVKIGVLIGFFAEPFTVNLMHVVDSGVGDKLTGLVLFVSMFFTMNLILVILNLIPLPPLDGSSIVALLLSDDVARKYKQIVSNPAFGFIGLMLAWLAFTPLFQFIFVRVINIVYWGAGFS